MPPFLPTEILVKVLSYLGYFDLLCARAVGQRFRDIVDSSRGQIGRTLFQPTAFPKQSLTNIIEPHPCLLNLMIRAGGDGKVYSRDLPLGPECFGFMTKTGEFIPVSQCSIKDDSAFSPPRRRLEYTLLWNGGKIVPHIRSRMPLDAGDGQMMSVVDLVESMDIELGASLIAIIGRRKTMMFERGAKIFNGVSRKLVGEGLERATFFVDFEAQMLLDVQEA